ncbi:family 43 glycosylhydrolase [Carboxylicivirga sediminis]|uniref:Family 43 glycosylhydrolase n=1 Tax=Carboxylicivirga sediminis TaxID=2006564 RepID=A0A941F003_9BACT|nr:family 43 glycosylhydrolase [Carboxylicivirga sediminis]MBR8534483.1 family 43 glycosylhydrolase [Carboxylicivirga sediminis]
MFRILLLFICAISLVQTVAEGQTTWCNPVDVDYQYGEFIPHNRSNFKDHPPIIARGSADPVFINHHINGKHEGYYLFSTSARGYWRSDDLVSWTRIIPKGDWPVSYFKEQSSTCSVENWNGQELYFKDMIAPAAISHNDTLFLMASSRKGKVPVFYSVNPAAGEWAVYEESLTFPTSADGNIWDPGLFYDDEQSQWYIYWGSSNLYPLYGTKLISTKTSSHFDLDSRKKAMIYLYPELHGWERFGRDHRSNMHPYIEGPEVDKYNGKYYLTYAGPGTSENMYGNGVYTADSPLGPWEYAPNNPVAYKPGGFLNGAGHGNLFQDKHGNYWNTGTSWIGVNWVFERRISMLPACFDQDGLMYANSRFADFPQLKANEKWTDSNDLFAGWMLLSYKKDVKVSSQKDDALGGQHLTDENPRTYWVAKDNKAGEYAIIDLGDACQVNAIQLNYSDYLQHDTSLYAPYPVRGDLESHLKKVYNRYKVYTSLNGKKWSLIADKSAEMVNRSNPYIELPESIEARYIKFENIHTPTQNLALSDIRIFGKGRGQLPAQPQAVIAKRDTDDRNAFISWQVVDGAVGYNILWGIAPDKLYSCYQVWADEGCEREVRALNSKQEYYFAIEAFNEVGVSELSEIHKCK